MTKAGHFSKLVPHNMLFQGRHFEHTDSALYVGRGGGRRGTEGGGGGRIGEIVKKGHVYHDF